MAFGITWPGTRFGGECWTNDREKQEPNARKIRIRLIAGDGELKLFVLLSLALGGALFRFKNQALAKGG
jgi:hypothetical protein